MYITIWELWKWFCFTSVYTYDHETTKQNQKTDTFIIQWYLCLLQWVETITTFHFILQLIRTITSMALYGFIRNKTDFSNGMEWNTSTYISHCNYVCMYAIDRSWCIAQNKYWTDGTAIYIILWKYNLNEIARSSAGSLDK